MTRRHGNMAPGDRTSEWVSRRIGSMTSIVLHTVAFALCFVAVFLGWIALEAMLLWLTTIVSLEAIYIGLFLQNSSNRHGDAAEANAKLDAETNIKAEEEVEELQQALVIVNNKLNFLISTQAQGIDW
ncbi:MAG: DUF1003 domain-containing protein [Alphaproteobacteria bacterium]|nr:DUF1003 domain-containing protein [Alphaproteobacteria bacterium]